jgi:hypothetical protein
MTMNRPPQTETQKTLLIELVAARPASKRSEIRLVARAGDSMAFIERDVDLTAPIWPHDLDYLSRLGLVLSRMLGPHTYSIAPSPLADIEVELLLAEKGLPTSAEVARRRTESLDRRYETFGRRLSYVVAGLPIFALFLAAVVLSEAANVLHDIPVPALVVAGIIVIVLAAAGVSVIDIARRAAMPAARRVSHIARRLIEGSRSQPPST